MSNTKDILIKLKDATINQALPLNDLPVEDIKEAIKAEYSISFGENSSEYDNLAQYCNRTAATFTSISDAITFLDTMINYSTSVDNISSNNIELPDNINPDDQYLTYLNLAEQYKDNNINQYYLCIENAYYHCKEASVKDNLYNTLKAIKSSPLCIVKPVSIVIISYNNMYLTQKCIESLRSNLLSDSYEIIVVDNASTDGVTSWLEMQPDIKLIKSDVNLGFPKGCNVGINASVPDNDIFLLNNDTRITPNALFWLRMGLYTNDTTGATGSVSNYTGTTQLIDVFYTSIDDYQRFGYLNNQIMDNPLEESTILCGFAMLIKRSALNKTTLLSEELSPGYFDDDDISFQLKSAGYSLYVCHNSFIYHAGSQSFSKVDTDYLLEISKKNRTFMYNKWHFDNTQNRISDKILDIIKPNSDLMRVLEINAHAGANYAHLKYICPNISYIGIEGNINYSNVDIKEAHIKYMNYLDFNYSDYNEYFDYIIFNDTSDYSDNQKNEFLNLARTSLKKNGALLLCDKNTLN